MHSLPPWYEPLCEPAGNRIRALIQQRAENVASGVHDSALKMSELSLRGLVGLDNQDKAINESGETEDVFALFERRTIKQDITETGAQTIKELLSVAPVG